MSVAFAPERDTASTRAALAAVGLHPSEPRALGRALELPEGDAMPRFSLLNLPPEETPGLDCFVCGHLTPELVRRSEWLAHANGVTGIKAVHLLADDPAALAPAYRQLFGEGRVRINIDSMAVDTERNVLSFTTPDAFRNSYPVLKLGSFSMPVIAALELSVTSREQSVTYFQQAQIGFIELFDGRLAVPAGEANGTTALFAMG